MDVWTSVHGATRAWPRAGWVTCSPESSRRCWRRAATRGRRPASAQDCTHVPAIVPRGTASAACSPAICWRRYAHWATDSTMTEHVWRLADEAATLALGRRFATALDGGERIKSPTYSLVEGYEAQGRPAWHLDLYRIADPGELEWLGLDALADPAALVLVEWPERGRGALPAPDLTLHLAYVDGGRQARLQAQTGRGRDLQQRLR